MNFGAKEKMITTIGCEYCGASFGEEHEEWCPIAKRKKQREGKGKK